MKAFVDALLTRDPAQRSRLLQTLLGLGGCLVGVCVVQLYVWTGWVGGGLGLLWSLLALVVPLGFYAAIRLGWTRTFNDPALTLQYVLFAVAMSTAGYALIGPARGAMLAALVLAITFGLYGLSPKRMTLVAAFAAGLYALVVVFMVNQRPNQFPLAVELGHFAVLLSLLGAILMLSRRIERLRQRSRQTRVELTQALERLRDGNTRDELTGLINKRHMQSLLEREHQRCIRSGQTFCLAIITVDNHPTVLAEYGRAVSDAVTRAVADEAQRQLRAADVLCRWSDASFLVLMPDSRALLARSGLDRMTDKLGALRILHGTQALGVALSCGLAEHLAGERVEQTLSHAESLMGDALAPGVARLKVVV